MLSMTHTRIVQCKTLAWIVAATFILLFKVLLFKVHNRSKSYIPVFVVCEAEFAQMLVNNITSKAKYQNGKAERLIVKMQKYRKFFFFNEHVYYIKYQQDITTINKKNTTN